MRRLILDNFFWKRPQAGIKANVLCCKNTPQVSDTFLLGFDYDCRLHPLHMPLSMDVKLLHLWL